MNSYIVQLEGFFSRLREKNNFDHAQRKGGQSLGAHLGRGEGLEESEDFLKLYHYKTHWFFCGYFAYLRHIDPSLSTQANVCIVLKHKKLAGLLWDFFLEKFSPESKKTLENASSKLNAEENIGSFYDKEPINKLIAGISCGGEKKFFEKFFMILQQTQRTNVAQNIEELYPQGHFSSYFSFKIIKDPVIMDQSSREIFVFSPRFEGVHFKGGKVARGGIRWCDTLTTFRAEVFNLFSAQVQKNTVVVPTGGKGGFVLKNPPQNKESLKEAGIACYKLFISALLSLTDNRDVEGLESHPDNTLCYDGKDSYLVAAADKGTSTFSNIANDIALEKKFWLGDAFASGGSYGYDHKELGITSRGAWVSVCHHLESLGINPEEDVFDAVGVGGMGGDVFGNGVLLSKKMRLLGAFSHKDIFIDPNPDPLESFKERERLFHISGVSWSDYDRSKLSAGGQILSRKEEKVRLSKESQALLGLNEKVSPDAIIKEILRLSCDVLWLGGIGTYVKGAHEQDLEIRDFSNDFVRICGKEVGARVVGEGANLGFTQKGRLEYAEKGGRINTDYLDNSAGVDCSDHEVNLKILFSKPLQKGELSFQERNRIIKDLTQDMVDHVLENNRGQNQVVSFMEKHSGGHKELYVNLGKVIEERMGIQVDMKAQRGEGGFLRPEICFLLSSSKIFYKTVVSKILGKEPRKSDVFLLNYFPKSLHASYEKDICGHALGHEIAVTMAVNRWVNVLGPCFFVEDMKEIQSIQENWEKVIGIDPQFLEEKEKFLKSICVKDLLEVIEKNQQEVMEIISKV